MKMILKNAGFLAYLRGIETGCSQQSRGYDDGFLAYLRGIETVISKSPILAPGARF